MTTTSQQPGGAARPDRRVPANRVYPLAGAILVVAALLYAGEVRDAEPLGIAHALPWWFWFAAFLLADVRTIRIPVRGGSTHVNLADIPFAFGLFVADPATLVTARVVAGTLMLVVRYRPPAPKAVFNPANLALGACALVTVFQALADPGRPLATRNFAAALLAMEVSGALVVALIGVGITLATGAPPGRRWLDSAGLSLLVCLGSGALSLLAVRMVLVDPAASWLLIGPAAVLLLAYGALRRARDETRLLQFLNEVSNGFHRGRSVDDTVVGTLRAARDFFGSDVAQLVLAQEVGAALVTTVGPGPEVTTMTPHAAVAGHDRARRLGRLVSPGDPDVPWLPVPSHHVLSGPVIGAGGPLGVLVVARSRRNAHRFVAAELRGVEVLGRSLGLLLENRGLTDRLTRTTALTDTLKTRASHDPLTGLGNRAAFLEGLERSLATGEPVAVLFVDLDDFKRVNHRQGHAAGDWALRVCGRRLQSCVRGEDVVARIGGDEFVILVRGADAGEHATDVARRVIDLMSFPFTVDGYSVQLGASVGIAVSDGAAVSSELVARADAAMYQAKRGGKGRYAIGVDPLEGRQAS